MKNALKLGVVMSLISVTSSLISTNLIDATTIFSSSYLWGSMGITLILLILLGRRFLRPKDYQGLSYGEALKYLFVASIIYYSVSQIVTILIYGNNTKVEEAFNDYAVSSQIAGLKLGMKMAGADDIRIENEVEELKEKIESGEIPLADYPFTWSSLPMNILMSMIFGLIFSLIAAIFVKQTG